MLICHMTKVKYTEVFIWELTGSVRVDSVWVRVCVVDLQYILYMVLLTGQGHLFFCLCPWLRHLRADCLSAGGGGPQPGQRAGHVPAQPALPADPADAAYGPTRRNLEAAGLSHLRPQ